MAVFASPHLRRPSALTATAITLLMLGAALFASDGEQPSPHSAALKRFQDEIAPVLERRCVSCHNDGDRKGGLSLQSAAALAKGGDSGPAIVAGQPQQSLLIQQIVSDRPGVKPDMPKLGAPLTDAQVASFRQWVAAGAPWPAGRELAERPAADNNWWSLHPIARPAVPSSPETRPGVAPARGPIDAFIRTQLVDKKLAPSVEADRRTLARRVAFDLTGLPPDADVLDELAADSSPDAYERFVDRLLASPRYGERWARHWLDVVHYGDTHGYDKDQPRRNAWPYRDYVIRALNGDTQYTRFIQQQLAGDVLWPGDPDAFIALGFISAGPWDLISHAEVPETKTDGKIARNLDRDDMVVNTLNTFCSATVQCARCHHHKFDPFAMQDYYRLQAVFAALDRADKAYDVDPAVGQRRVELNSRIAAVKASQRELDERIKSLGGEKLAALDRRIAELTTATNTPPQLPTEYGYHSAIEPQPDRPKWVQIDLGRSVPIARVTTIGCWDAFANIGAGFGFPSRYKIELSDDPTFQAGVSAIADRSSADVPNPGTTPVEHPAVVAGATGAANGANVTRTARYVRVTATKLAVRQNDYIFALAELQVFDAEGRNAAQGATVTSLDSIEAGPRWRRTNLVDGLFPKSARPADAAALVEAKRERDELLSRVVDASLRQRQAALQQELADVDSALKSLPPQQVTFAGVVHNGSGNFVGRGAMGGKPRPIHILARGDVRKPGLEVGPGAPAIYPEAERWFELPADAPEGQRRVALAQWIVDHRNPLTWRSIVNRVWQYHFGRGIVESASDFGRMGRAPSHPELLEWLAVEFRDGPQSLKLLHRQLVTTSTYRQSSVGDEARERLDAGNVYLWRMNRRKLEAEAIRDSVLAVSGRLDYRMGGPGFQDFVVERPEHSPHYEYHLHDPEDPRIQRRSVYRFLVRSQPQPFMTTLDCADPSMSVDKRNETINALQALALLNNKLTVSLARHFADRVAREAPDPRSQVARAFRLALSRDPTSDELDALIGYANQHGLSNACRLILNLNEFAFVD